MAAESNHPAYSTSRATAVGQRYRHDVSGTPTSGADPSDDDGFPPAELEDYGKARYEATEGPRAVVREARRILREVVRSERRAEREAKPPPGKWDRRKADRDKR